MRTQSLSNRFSQYILPRIQEDRVRVWDNSKIKRTKHGLWRSYVYLPQARETLAAGAFFVQTLRGFQDGVQ